VQLWKSPLPAAGPTFPGLPRGLGCFLGGKGRGESEGSEERGGVYECVCVGGGRGGYRAWNRLEFLECNGYAVEPGIV
jgi:hypothetical protein